MTEDEFYLWSERELDIIKKHKEYHQEMITFMDDLENKGPKIPSPKKNLQAVCQDLPSQVSFWVKSCIYVLKKKFLEIILIHQIYLKKTFESLKLYFKKCAEHEKTINKKILEFHLEQEKLLEQLHSLWIEKRAKDLCYLIEMIS